MRAGKNAEQPAPWPNCRPRLRKAATSLMGQSMPVRICGHLAGTPARRLVNVGVAERHDGLLVGPRFSVKLPQEDWRD